MQKVQIVTPGKPQQFGNSLTTIGEDQELLLFFVGRGKDEFTVDTLTYHQAIATGSLTTVRGVLFDQAKATIKGLIRIAPNAQQANAFLEEKVLLLGPKAQAEAVPQLEIEANDVKASHAATIGKVNEDEVFYLQSRGLTQAEAESMIVLGFFRSSLDKIKDKDVRDKTEKEIKEMIELRKGAN